MYSKSIKEPNVRLIKTGVAAFTPTGCVDDNGEEHEFDIGICATGFDTSFIPRFPIIGMHGKNLQDMWADAPSSYMGIGVAHFPNYLTILGPYSPVANGPTLASIGQYEYWELSHA
jgi:cation diffusion facilitator CzcD-associated flavoprotein CzcO